MRWFSILPQLPSKYTQHQPNLMTKAWINYWRNSLADGERMERHLIKLKHYTLDRPGGAPLDGTRRGYDPLVMPDRDGTRRGYDPLGAVPRRDTPLGGTPLNPPKGTARFPRHSGTLFPAQRR